MAAAELCDVEGSYCIGAEGERWSGELSYEELLPLARKVAVDAEGVAVLPADWNEDETAAPGQ